MPQHCQLAIDGRWGDDGASLRGLRNALSLVPGDPLGGDLRDGRVGAEERLEAGQLRLVLGDGALALRFLEVDVFLTGLGERLWCGRLGRRIALEQPLPEFVLRILFGPHRAGDALLADGVRMGDIAILAHVAGRHMTLDVLFSIETPIAPLARDPA